MLVAVAVLVAVVPVVAAGMSVIGEHWYASSDQGIELLRIADVGTEHTPLVGAWSRLGFSHPGPLLFWLLAPVEWLFGATGVLVGVSLLNALAVSGAVLLAARDRGRPATSAVVIALAGAVLVHATGPALLVDVWNPWAPVLPFFCFLVAAWRISAGDSWVLPIAVGVGSFCVQCHTSYAPLVAGVLAVAMVVARWPRRRDVLVAAVVGVVLWLPPITQQLTGTPGNLTEILSEARHPADAAVGWSDAIGVLGEELRVSGPWLTGDEVDTMDLDGGWRVVPALVVIALLAAAAMWRRARLAMIAIAAIGLGVVTTARQTGLLATYLIRWWWPIAALAFGAIVLAATSAVRMRTATAVVGLVAATAVSIATLTALPAAVPFEAQSDGIAAVLDRTTDALDRDDRYLVRGIERAALNAIGVGLFVALEREGFDVRLDPLRNAALTYGRWRLAHEDDVDAIVTITADADVDAGWQPPPEGTLLADDAGYVVYLTDQ